MPIYEMTYSAQLRRTISTGPATTLQEHIGIIYRIMVLQLERGYCFSMTMTMMMTMKSFLLETKSVSSHLISK